MHRALQTLDVFLSILEHLHSQKKYATLTSFGRTCKAFLPSCMYFVWRTPLDFQALLSLLPPRTQNVTNDFARFRFYSEFVQVMYLVVMPVKMDAADYSGFTANKSDLDLLALASPVIGPVFPRLKRLLTTVYETAALATITTLLSQSLESFEPCFCLAGNSSYHPRFPKALDVFLKELVDRAPNLSHINIEEERESGYPCIGDSIKMQSRICKCMGELQGLRRVEVDFHPGPELLSSLAQCVRRLSNVSVIFDSYLSLRHLPTEITYASLTTLSLSGTIPQLLGTLDVLCAPCLRDSTLVVTDAAVADNMKYDALCLLISKKWNDIEKLSLRLAFMMPDSSADPAQFHALFSCHALEAVAITVRSDNEDGLVMWDDNFLAAVVDNWRHLKHLELRSSEMFYTCITIAGIIDLTRGCRHLQSLALAIDVDCVEDFSRSPPVTQLLRWELDSPTKLEWDDLVAVPELRHLFPFVQLYPGDILMDIDRAQLMESFCSRFNEHPLASQRRHPKTSTRVILVLGPSKGPSPVL